MTGALTHAGLLAPIAREASGTPAARAGRGALRSDPSVARVLILQRVREQPGVCVRELSERLGCARTAVVWHVRRLVKQGRLVVVRRGRRNLHFLPGVAGARGRLILGLLGIATVAHMVAGLRMDPYASWRELAARCDVSPHTVRWHLRRLERQGLVEIRPSEERHGHVALLHPELERAAAAWSSGGDATPTPLVESSLDTPGVPA